MKVQADDPIAFAQLVNKNELGATEVTKNVIFVPYCRKHHLDVEVSLRKEFSFYLGLCQFGKRSIYQVLCS